MHPQRKQGLLLASNSEITDEQLDSIIHQEPITDFYHLDKDYFARGKFAHVRRIRHKQNGQQFAAKTMKKRRIKHGDVTEEIRHEIRVLMITNQLNQQSSRIVRLYEVFETSNDFTLVLELAEGGELQKVLDEEESIEEHHCRRIMRQIVEGVQTLHRKQIAHLDIKPQNILLTNALPDGHVKLCDFGISRLLQEKCEVKEIMGTPDYMPPEILQYEPISLAADMWSIGIVAYVLLSGLSPFGSDDKFQTYSNITSAELDFPEGIFNCISEQAKDFIRKLLVRDPKKRMTCDQCLEHEWLSLKVNHPSPSKNTFLDDNLKPEIDGDKSHSNNDDSANTSDLEIVDSDDACSSDAESANSGSSSTTIATSSLTFSSINSLDEVVDVDQNPKSISKSNTSDDESNINRDSGLGENMVVNICDNNDTKKAEDKFEDSYETCDDQSASNPTNKNNSGHFSDDNNNCKLSLEQMDVFILKNPINENNIDSGKENRPVNNSEMNLSHLSPLTTVMTTGATKYHHKRLSSDTFPDRKLIAVVASSPLSATKKFTSESSMSTTMAQADETNKTISGGPTLLVNDTNTTNDLEKTTTVTVVSGPGDQSPPSTPSKKFYLSVDDYDFSIGNYLRKSSNSWILNKDSIEGGNSPPRRIRSMERLNSTTQLPQHHHSSSFDHYSNMKTETIPLATLETHTISTSTTVVESLFAKRNDQERTMIFPSSTINTSTIIRASSAASTSIKMAEDGGFRIQVTKSLLK